ncbi:MgtA Cation transport ATPase [Pyrenophora tritici-repentis]|nr:MgtA Cation transport ATPase [Pyrenophora tritici-repentis]
MSNASDTPCDDLQYLQHDASSSSDRQSEIVDAATSRKREYEFFVTTGEPQQPNGTERGMIRRLVMRNFFDTKASTPPSNASEHRSASTAMSEKQLKNRFRLLKPTNEKKGTKSRESEQDSQKGIAKGKRPRAPRTTSSTTKVSSHSGDGKSRRNSTDRTGSSSSNRIPYGSEANGTMLSVDPGAHRMDPFDVLPVPGTPELDMLFRLYKGAPKNNAVAVDAKSTWNSFVLHDPGLLHATLAGWALYGMLVEGISALRVCKLNHKSEAIKTINNRLASSGGKISDEVVGTVLTLASFENLTGEYDAAQLHISALKRMIHERGGLLAFGHNDGLLRGIIWIDFHTAAAFRTPPSFQHVHLDLDIPPFPEDLLEEAVGTSPTSLLRLSTAAVDCFNIFYQLHRLALAASSHWFGRVARLTLSNVLYETQFIILSVPDYSRVFLEFDRDADEEHRNDFMHRRHQADAASVVEGLLAAMLIYVYAVLRGLPLKANIFSILLNRLRAAIDRPNSSAREVWEREHNLNMLVWALDCVHLDTTTTTMAPLVDSPQIKQASLHNPLPLQLHTYIWPFLIVWPAFSAIYFSPSRYEQYIQSSEWTFVWVASITTFQSLFWLMTHWNVNLKSAFTTTAASDVRSAQLIKVQPIKNAGAAEIVKLVRDNVGGKPNLSFLFQKRRFLYDADKGSFAPLSYALDTEPKPLLKTFQQTQGLTTPAEIERLTQHYGDNAFDIPVPTFTELFKEHAVAPFFVFQVFCVGLWMLDEYWYYSLFTLFMLVVFESTVVWQRQRTLNEFRGMSIKPYEILVYRQKKWQEIMSDKLLPGDVVSAGRTKEDSGVACDMLLLEGSAIVNEAMLSGESTPVLKESVQLRPGDARIEPEGLDKNSFLWGGTKVLQVSHGNDAEEDGGTVSRLSSGVPPPPDKGAVAVVIKTGFETNQGSLVRTMIFATERVSANNVEALFFILFLTVFAVAASWYVWQEGVRLDRQRNKLLLDCVLIVTSVVPPELPMELSLAVNTSLAALSKYAIFCTEPFRIPFAGQVDVACFDKTGTLTGEDLVVDGIAGLSLGESGATIAPDGAHTDLTKLTDVGTETTLVLAAAHALVKLDDGETVGEPMEKATLQSLNWKLGAKDTLQATSTTAKSHAELVHIRRRFQFSSALKRQSSVATIIVNNNKTGRKVRSTIAAVKGAPETIRKMLVNTPPHYEETFKHFTRNGGRVLALAYKFLSEEGEWGQNRINDLKREQVESELHFAGFLVLQCPLKPDAIEAVRALNESSHRVVMITGDNPLTAVHVAKQVEIVDRDCYILDAPENDETGEKLVWRSVDDKVSIPVDPTKPLDSEILKTKDICLTGYALAKFTDQPGWKQILRYTWVYARVSPKQKEEILLGLKDCGYTTLMAGDGTNDVGALKQAHIGVALLNGTREDLDKIGEHFRNTQMKNVYEKQCNLMQRFNQPQPPVPIVIAHLYPPGPANPHYEKAMEAQAKKKGLLPAANGIANGTDSNGTLVEQKPGQAQTQQAAANFAQQMQEKMMAQEMEELAGEPPTIKLGDASVAAPFTSKLANVVAIPNIIRQGRCTLVATIQMYKILALNCLISAYSLSVLYLDGIKFGDGQVTISGMMMSVCFLSISRAKTVEALSKERPQHNIFNTYIIGSVLGQFAIHIVTLIYVSQYVQRVEPKDPNPDLEKEFEPSLLNSAIYLLQLIQQISTFAINYQGRPFRESIRENKGMYWGLISVSGVAFSCATEFIPELNQKLKLVPFTSDFKFMITSIMAFDFVACYVIEKSLKFFFSDNKPKDIAIRRPDQLERENERKRKEELDAQRKKNEEMVAMAREKGLVK